MTDGEKKPFWTTLTGIMTGIAALLTAVAGILIFLNPPSINSFSASPDTIAPGEITTLSWSVSGANIVTINPEIGNVPSSGSRQISPRNNTTYILNARSTFRSSTAITDVKIVNETSAGSMASDNKTNNPTGAESPAPPTLNPSTPNSSTPSNNASQPAGPANESPGPVSTPKASPAILYFTASPDTIRTGESSELSWNVSRAEVVRIDQGIGQVGASGSIPVSPLETRTYTLTALSGSGRDEEKVTVTVIPSAAATPGTPPGQQGQTQSNATSTAPLGSGQQSRPSGSTGTGSTGNNTIQPANASQNQSAKGTNTSLPAKPPASAGNLTSTSQVLIPFSFTGWGNYYGFLSPNGTYFSGYGSGYLYEVSGSKSLENSLISRVIYELPNGFGTKLEVGAGSTLALMEGFELNITSIQPAEGSIYLNLIKDGTIINSKMISPFKKNSTIGDGTYYYLSNIGTARNIVILAVHFRNDTSGFSENRIAIDGIWQISQSPITYRNV
ncbi:MAG: S-layer protein domain-containing protein [Methanotrichaceae archaeon]